jgi:ubiquitin C-terminal hydrolase
VHCLGTWLCSHSADLFRGIQQKSKTWGTVAPRGFLHRLRNENGRFHLTPVLFGGYQQQDAHEFLNYILNEILEVSARLERRPMMAEMFEGKLRTDSGCLALIPVCRCCEGGTKREETFLDLSVDISNNTSLTHCLKRFCSPEILRGQDKFYCADCSALQEAEKRCVSPYCRVTLVQLPKVLVVQMKRFKFVGDTFRKLYCRVTFPFELVLDSEVGLLLTGIERPGSV